MRLGISFVRGMVPFFKISSQDEEKYRAYIRFQLFFSSGCWRPLGVWSVRKPINANLRLKVNRVFHLAL